ncbi:MAG: lantibiotic dehydratase [Parachlamydia sp.]
MNEPLFIPASFFLLRVPFWSIDELESMHLEDNWINAVLSKFDNDELFREAISIASHSLYQALQKRPLKNPTQVCRSLQNYINRMASRATPFGLFSFVTAGYWDEETRGSLDLTKVYRRARPDMEWIYALVKKFYRENSDFSALLVQSNSLVDLKGDRLFLKYFRFIKDKKIQTPKTISLYANRLVITIFEMAKSRLSIDQLWEKLLEVLPNLNKEKTFEVIKKLLSHQILLPGILPSLLSDSPFKELMKFLPNAVWMNELETKLSDYQSTSLGSGELSLQNLRKSMDAVVPIQSPLHVDASYKGTPIYLSNEILLKLQQAVTFLWKISASRSSQFTSLEAYRKKFIEKFGLHRIVPLKELLSEEKGLGSFLAYPQIDEKSVFDKFSQQWEKCLNKKWQESMLNHQKEIVLTEEWLNSLFELVEEELPDPCKALSSFDLFFKIQAQSIEEINRGNYQLYLSDCTWSGGSTFGRFWDLFNPEIQHELSKLAKAEKHLEKSAKVVEVSYWPSHVRNANVSVHPCLREYSLEIDNKDNSILGLEDLYIGTTHERFYITLKDGKEEILARSGNVLSYIQAPESIRLIREITLSRHLLLYPFYWAGLEEKAVFLPRVRMGLCILSPAKWNLDASSFLKDSLDIIKVKFLAWAEQWKLPDRFLMTEGDQHLLLTSKHPAHLNEIATRLKRGESLQLMEEITSEWLKSESGSHSGEFVVPFIKNSIYPYPENTRTPQAFETVKSRWMLPGSQWMYIKVYLSEEQENNFLLNKFIPFIEHLNEFISINDWFFVRYQDPERHLRFRLRIEDIHYYGLILSWLHPIGIQWMEQGLIKKIMLDSYEREVERYGGEDVMDAVESLFCVDSLAVTSLLKYFEKKEDTLETVCHILSIVSFLNGFGLDLQTKIDVLGNARQDQKLLKGFREYKNQLLKLIPALEDPNQPEEGICSVVNKFAMIRIPAQNQFLSKAQHIENSRLLEIYSHMIHMHCNRLGCDNSQETRLRLFCEHALKCCLKTSHIS